MRDLPCITAAWDFIRGLQEQGGRSPCPLPEPTHLPGLRLTPSNTALPSCVVFRKRVSTRCQVSPVYDFKVTPEPSCSPCPGSPSGSLNVLNVKLPGSAGRPSPCNPIRISHSLEIPGDLHKLLFKLCHDVGRVRFSAMHPLPQHAPGLPAPLTWRLMAADVQRGHGGSSSWLCPSHSSPRPALAS